MLPFDIIQNKINDHDFIICLRTFLGKYELLQLLNEHRFSPQWHV